MDYSNYHYWGMHLFWWFFWCAILFWIFLTPYNIPGQRMKTNTPLDILKKRLALGEITNDEFQEKKLLLE